MENFLYLLPEAILVTTTLALVCLEFVGLTKARTHFGSAVAIIGISGAFIAGVLLFPTSATRLFGDFIVIDGFSSFFKLIAIAVVFLSIVFSLVDLGVDRTRRSEYFALLVTSALASCLLASASNLILIFVALQLFSVISFFLIGFTEFNEVSAKSAMKFLSLSTFASFLFLSFLVVVYFKAGTFDIFLIKKNLMLISFDAGLSVFIFASLFLSLTFYMGIFPFYLWIPDVIESARAPTSFFLVTTLPAIGTAVFIRLFVALYLDSTVMMDSTAIIPKPVETNVIAVCAALTMISAAFMAVWKRSLTKIIAFLIVFQSGFYGTILLGLDSQSVSIFIFALLVGLFSLLGLYFSIFLISRHSNLYSGKFSIEGLRPSAVEAVFLLLFLASFVGFPPFPGFLEKFALISSVFKHGWHGISLISIFSTIVAGLGFARLACLVVLERDASRSQSVVRGTFDRTTFLFVTASLTPLIVLSFASDRILIFSKKLLESSLW